MSMMRDKLTVLVQTSPIPSHPSTALIEALFRSFTKADGLLESRVVILADGCEEIGGDGDCDVEAQDLEVSTMTATATLTASTELQRERENIKHGKASSETASNYREFLKELKCLVSTRTPPFCPHNDGRIELVELPARHGSAPAIRKAMESIVSTPLVMVCQHDNFFVNHAPLRQVVDAMCTIPDLGINATCVHFLSTSTISYQQKVKLRYGLDLPPVKVPCLDYPLVPLAFWYGRSHVTYSSYVRNYVLNRNLPKGSHLEEILGPTQLADIIARGPEAHKTYGTYVLDQGFEVLYHLSGRRARRATPSERQTDGQKERIHGVPTGTIDLSRPATLQDSSAPPTTVMEGAFTSARSCRATIPGLVFMSVEPDRKQLPRKFKGRCYHCNKRGHSKMHCPLMTSTDKQQVEVIDLS
jgi:hypothetical protein